MAPALTEPLNSTDNLNESAVTASNSPIVKNSRKLDSSIVNKTGISSKTKVLTIKSATPVREKRCRNIIINVSQIPTSSKRVTRSLDNIQRNSLAQSTSINRDNLSKVQQIITSRKTSKLASVHEGEFSVNNSLNNSSSVTKNEQMGLSKALLNNKNKIFNNINNTNTTPTFDNIEDNTKDPTTEKLLADLTNEAITAEICLRNQLKDVNLVKSSRNSSSPIIQQESFVDRDTDIVDLEVAPKINKTTSAHMEAQFNEIKSSNFLDSTSSKKVEETISTLPAKKSFLKKEDNDGYKKEECKNKDAVVEDKCRYDDNEHERERCSETDTTQNYIETSIVHKTSETSPHLLDDASETKKSVPKLDILSVQALPPVSTDSTMTASEVEDNLEERLSQLDGTAIDSPPPANHSIDSNQKNGQNSIDGATPPRTPPNQEMLCNDLEELQEELQQTPPTPVAQKIQSNHLELQQQQPQQTHCFTSPQTTTPINLLGNLGGNVSQPFTKETDNVGSATDLEDQDIEEVFKVLKGFEGGTTSELNVCDLNVLFNEVYMKINETEISGNTGSCGNIANGISSNAQHVAAVTNPSIQLVKPTEVEEGQMAMEKRQQLMQRKIDFLMRRLRKLQARYMCKHTSEEIAGLFEWAARQATKGVTNPGSLQHCESLTGQDPSRCFLKVIAARPPASDWKDIQETLVAANQISTFLRKIESVANAQQLCTTPSANLLNITHKKSKKALMEAQAAAATTVASNCSVIGGSISNESKAEEVVVATLDENITDELSQVAGLLQIEMSEVQKSIDSDATESSSGGESADEMVTYNNIQQQTLPITKRAAWRYSRDRAAIASRWSWLLSQISDLEIKIRQHSDLHQEVIRSKGPVTCGSQVDEKCTIEDDDYLNGSCRTRGYIPSLFRKRKLIQTTNIHTISKKAARPSTIKCGCQWPLNPCALCTGRSDPTAPRDLPDTMMMSDRIALLDSGYHPVLSFRENVNNALHFEAIAKQPEWQQRVMRCQAKSIAKNIWKAEREAIAAATGGHHTSSKKYSEAHLTKRRYIKKKDKQNNGEKTGGKTSYSTKSSQLHNATTFTSASSVPSLNTSLASTTSLNDVGNGTANLSNSSSTTPLVANRGMVKSARKQNSSIVMDEFLRDPSNTLLPPKCSNNTTFPAATYSPARTTSILSNKKYIHQTSDCPPINYDQFNPKQIHSSSISNNQHHNNNSKSNKHRKLSSSTVINSHHYNHHNNNSSNLYNGDSNYMFSNEYWGGGDNFSIRSRTSSPTHGNSSNIHHKYERLLDRKNRTSYDIDNIVIPYSVAAATRVELLPYKEIPTPKWRLIASEEVINKLETSEKQDFEIDNSLGAILLKNGYVSDESINTNTICSGNKKENSTVAVVEESKEETLKPNNTKESDIGIEKTVEENMVNIKDCSKESNSCLAITISSPINNNVERSGKENVKFNISNDDNENDTRFDGCTTEPKIKKIKIESNVVNDGTESSEGKTEEETDKEKMIQENEEEDISDEAMFLRHERALTEERRKFQTYLKFPWSTRSRANRRIDSRAESSGANTPDPSSPAPQTPSVGGGDLESIPSPSNPATPLNSLDTISEAGDNSTSFLGINSLPSLISKRYERRRTTSTKRDREVERRSSTPDSKELVAPYEPLTFPLSDAYVEELMRVMPVDHGEDSKRFDDCYLPGSSGSGVIGSGGISSSKYPRTVCSSISKRSSRASTLCGDVIATTTSGCVGGRRIKSSNFNHLRPISADDSPIHDMLLYDDDYEDDYPKHHLAPNDNHLATESVGVGKIMASDCHYIDDDDDVYGNQYDAYVGRKQHKHCGDSEEETSEEEPFQDDDPNDPEWRGETEERLRKKM